MDGKPAGAVIESPNEGVIAVSALRPLGRTVFTPQSDETSPAVGEPIRIPSTVVFRSANDSIRLSDTPIPSPWAEVTQTASEETKGEGKVRWMQ